MAKERPIRAGLFGELVFDASLPTRHTDVVVIVGEMLSTFDSLDVGSTLDSVTFNMVLEMVADNTESPVEPIVGELVHYDSGAGRFLFDNRGETPVGIIARSNGQMVSYRMTDYDMRGSGKTVTANGEKVVATFNGGGGGGSTEFEIAISLTGGAYANEIVSMYLSSTAYLLPEDLTGSVGVCYNTTPVNVDFDILKENAVIGQVRVINNEVSFVFNSDVTFDGDIIKFQAKSDVAFQSLTFTIPATKI